MKIATYSLQGVENVGVLTPGGDALCPLGAFGYECGDMLQAIRLLDRGEVSRLSARLAGGEAPGALPLDSVTLLAPIPRPEQDILCLGVNYAEHALECGFINEALRSRKAEPAIYFSKRVSRAVDPEAPVDSHPDLVDDLDYEAELAVIVGKDALNVAESDAESYIFGYTILNDISARTLQRTHKQWYRGKSLDGFTPWVPGSSPRTRSPFPRCWTSAPGSTASCGRTAAPAA